MHDSIHIPVLTSRDHGGGVDAAVSKFGGRRADWLDLSTGINPICYPLPDLPVSDWTELPDGFAQQSLLDAARRFWSVPDGAEILAAPGASALIARIPGLSLTGAVHITTPTYNEHAAGFAAHGWKVVDQGPADARVIVNPNNPDGRIWTEHDANAPLTVIDESFCDVCPQSSLTHLANRPGYVILKSFGKFWGLAGLRLGFAIAKPETIAKLSTLMGPWAVSGPALRVGTIALSDQIWADETRVRLASEASRLDSMMSRRGASVVGGTSLFRLYEVDDAAAWQTRLARAHIWSRTFPYSHSYLRLGLPRGAGWRRLEAAL
jgi:cobalamin biosynthesis protein CobC